MGVDLGVRLLLFQVPDKKIQGTISSTSFACCHFLIVVVVVVVVVNFPRHTLFSHNLTTMISKSGITFTVLKKTDKIINRD